MYHAHAYRSGFTIVELLIVIVVIAILAAISIVAYNGVQDNARLSTAKNDMANIKKSLMMYKAEKGRYPENGVQLTDARLKVTGSVYSPVSGYGNLVYCLNTDTDEFAFMATLVGGAASSRTSVLITSLGGVEATAQLPAFSDVCAHVGAGTGNRYVVSGHGASWLER